MGLVFCAILPHGPDIVPELTKDPARMAETRAAMQEAGRRFAASGVDALILLDPQTVHVLQGMALEERRLRGSTCFPRMGDAALSVGATAHAAGTIGAVRERFACDVSLARAILGAGRSASLPVAPDARDANGDLPLQGGGMIPLWYTLRPMPSPRPGLVVITPSPMVPRETLLHFGGLLARVVRDSGKRVALIASADQGHTYDAKTPRFGFSPAAAQHDAVYCKAVTENRLDLLLDIPEDLLREAWADSFWQTLILAGALREVPMTVGYFSFTVPTYYGMVVATWSPCEGRV